jgi:hypothetical protein
MATQDITKDEDKEKAEKILQEKLGQVNLSPDENKDVPPATAEDDIEKPIPHKEWHFEAEYELVMRGTPEMQTFSRTYIQKPLSYQAMAEFTGLLGRKLSEAMKGPEGLSIDRMVPGEAGIPLQFQDGRISIADDGSGGVDAIVQAFAHLASYVPDLLGESQCIWLRVPRQERALLMDIWSRPVDEGGMSLDQGEEMLSIFIEQNYDELESFLKRYGRVKDKLQKMRNRGRKDA